MTPQQWDHTYTYRCESRLSEVSGRPQLSLVTAQSGPEVAFFQGAITSPKRMADLLLTVMDVVQSRFYTPPAMLAKILAQSDPVITCSNEYLRFEGFSACCGVYARLDLLPGAVLGERLGFGTTNVNINGPMRSALSRVRDHAPLAMAVGAESLTVHSGHGSVIERKVTLPTRWLRGFTEVQATQAQMKPRFKMDGAAFRRFLRGLPPGLKSTAWLVESGAELRLSAAHSPCAIAIGGVARLNLLETAARHVEHVQVFAPDDGGATGWTLTTPDSRLHLVLSPDSWRGFSGEGQLLETLAQDAGERAMGVVRAALQWRETVASQDLADESGLNMEAIDWALSRCAASGLVGYDLHHGAYFHRELPFDLTRIPKLQPRLKAAHQLMDECAVTFDSAASAWVRSKDFEYRVTIKHDNSTCTCVWYAKHRGERGPCKHILAAQMALASQTEETK